MTDHMTAAVIGLGSMGWGAAVSLLRAGIETRGVDIRGDVLERFTAEGGTSFTSVSEACAGVDVVFVFVVNGAQAEDVLFGAGGAVAAAQDGTVFVTCVTMEPTRAIDLAERLEAAGMMALDAPVSGGSAKALTGEMTIMASGRAEAFDKAGPCLDAIASKVYRLGDAAGKGSQVKMINQLLAGVHIAAAAEALTLGAKIGLDLGMLHEVIQECAGNSWMFGNRGAHIVEGDYTPHSAVDIFVKDLGIVTGEAADHPVPLSQTALALFKEASAAGMGREDDAAVAKLLATKGGIKLPGMV
ncbi:3-hydroxyisobutyrate dehydrogenase [Litoreibacter ascidiaceicola]|uniref:L-threonate dehydrogenase n=1 Tax=Litoreibacter ascidiaceicola TaxID=1486859 RepID=A0A1M4SUY6_9RHOB|nr:L-threonate dehydrogenase [Litoreibacter ascidiaceicola]SHE36016.1 3-hydroxyisobutyrate dehydrogenase [Litoreibacter ascidiaceicola]